jgi:hypothetical protein
MRAASIESSRLLPLELEKPLSGPEDALLNALRNIGVLEFRATDRINMPDIFRVEAGIKRRGGGPTSDNAACLKPALLQLTRILHLRTLKAGCPKRC